jgi:hypothetical protein
MSEEVDQDSSNNKSIFRRPFWAVVGAITIGVIGSGLYDLLVKPGISHLGDWFFNIVSHWSVTIKDAPFGSAALDPTSLPSLIIIFLMGSIPIYLFSVILFIVPMKAIKEKLKKKVLTKKKRPSKTLKIASSIAAIVNIVCILLVIQTALSVLNKSIFIHRVFYSNLKICAPYINQLEEEKLISEFSNMETMLDYEKINSLLNKVATENGISLRKEVVK